MISFFILCGSLGNPNLREKNKTFFGNTEIATVLQQSLALSCYKVIKKIIETMMTGISFCLLLILQKSALFILAM